MFLSLVDVISAPQLWVSPDPEYRHLFAPLPRRLRRLMGIHPLFIAPPRSYMIVRARKKAAVGVMVRHLQRLDELEDSALVQKHFVKGCRTRFYCIQEQQIISIIFDAQLETTGCQRILLHR
jgi:hypothetical protein